MDFTEVIRKRRSFRSYRNTPVPEKSLQAIRECVALAPTACNRQPYKLLLVRDPEIRAKICRVYSADWLKQAPVIAVMLGDRMQCWTRLEGDPILDVDCAIAMEHFVLGAADQGLGTCWICAFNRNDMDQAVGISAPWHVFAISPLGYADASSVRGNSSKPLDELTEVIG